MQGSLAVIKVLLDMTRFVPAATKIHPVFDHRNAASDGAPRTQRKSHCRAAVKAGDANGD
jgi:hypothetical protein